jgi:ABC-type microcin C transport system permease subunit YejB
MSFRIWGSIILIVLGILFWLGKFGYINFYWERDWPVVLIAIGIFSLINYLAKRKRVSSIKNKKNVLDSLESGDIDVDEAVDRLKKM